MKYLLLIILLNSKPLFAPDIRMARIAELGPMQFDFGQVQTEIAYVALMDPDSALAQKFFRKRLEPISVVVAPNGRYYIVDGHHQTRIMAETYHDFVPIEVLEDFSQKLKDMKSFWKEMQRRQWVYLKSQGKLKSVGELPKTIMELANNQYRGLAWILTKIDVIPEVEIPYLEFYWADYLRKKMKNRRLKFTKSEIEEAAEIVRKSKKKDLPGIDGVAKIKKKKWKIYQPLLKFRSKLDHRSLKCLAEMMALPLRLGIGTGKF